MFRLDGRIALVTGGSRGIGRACCETLGAHGATVVVNYVKGEAAARSVAEAIGSAGGKADVEGFDVADSKAVDAGIEAIVKRHGKLDILVCNAGIAIDGLLLRLKDEDLEKLWATNVRGALACARASSRTMMRGRWGRIDLHVERRGRDGQRRPDGLRGDQGWAPGRGALHRPRVRIAKHHSQRHRSRIHRHGHDERDERRAEGAAREGGAARTHGRSQGHRRGLCSTSRARRPDTSPARSSVSTAACTCEGTVTRAGAFAPLPLDYRPFFLYEATEPMAIDIPSDVKRIIKEQLDVDEKDIKPESSFIDDLGADSLGLVELVLAFEEAFEIDIPDEDTEKIRTVQDAIDYIEKHAKK